MDVSSNSAQVTVAFIPLLFPFSFNPSFHRVFSPFYFCFYPSYNTSYPPSAFSNPIHFLFPCSHKVSVIFVLVHPFFLIAVPHRGYWLCFSAAPLCCCRRCGMIWLCMVANPSELFEASKSEFPSLSPNSLRSSGAYHRHRRLNFSLAKKHYKIFVVTRISALHVPSHISAALSTDRIYKVNQGDGGMHWGNGLPKIAHCCD